MAIVIMGFIIHFFLNTRIHFNADEEGDECGDEYDDNG